MNQTFSRRERYRGVRDRAECSKKNQSDQYLTITVMYYSFTITNWSITEIRNAEKYENC